MRESFVGFRHTVHVFLLFHRAAAAVRGIQDFFGKLVRHRLSATRPGIQHEPVDRQRLLPELIHFHRNLVVRAAHASRLHFEHRLAILDGLLKELERVVVRFLRHLVHRLVKNRLRSGTLAVVHHAGNKLLHEIAAINRISRNLSAKNPSFSRHPETLSYYFWAAFGRLAPYFERPCLRFSTPAASSVPRMTW